MTVSYGVGHGGISTTPLPGDVILVGDNPGYTSRADGSTGMSGVLITDPDAELDLIGLNKFEVDDDACDNPRIFTGVIYDRKVARTKPSHRVEAQRAWDCNLADQNAYLNLRIIHDGNHGNRPAESDVARVGWLLDEVLNAGHVINGTGGLFGANGPTSGVLAAPRMLDAADYRGQYAAEVLADIGPPGSRRFFVYWDPDLETQCLFYGLNVEYLGTATIGISNVQSDLSSTVFQPDRDVTLDRDPSAVYGAVYYTYRHGRIYREDPATIATYLDRGVSINNDRVGLASTASTFVDRILEKAGNERDSINVTITVPSDKVNHVIEGMRIPVRFSHLPGYETETYVHVLSRTVSDSATGFGWAIHLELCDYVGGFGTGGGGGGTGTVGAPPFVPSTPAQLVSLYENVTVINPATHDALVSDVFAIAPGNRPVRLDLRMAVNTGGRVTMDCTNWGGGGPAQPINDQVSSPSVLNHIRDINGPAGAATGCTVTITPDAGQTMVTHATDAGSVYYTDVTTTAAAPQIGQSTTESLAGVTAGTDYDLNYPYATGSLHVTVNGTVVTPTEVDPEAGTFELGFNATGQTVVVTYQIASATTTGSTNPQPSPTGSLPTSGAPTTADYLVGTAQAGLSAEIVVGATPGGELGGTWASPTVDPTHSGSTHDAATNTHIADATDAHDASAVSVLDTGGNFTGTDVEAVLAELAGASVTEDDIRDAGRWEVMMVDGVTPPEPMTTEDETDWLYAWISG